MVLDEWHMLTLVDRVLNAACERMPPTEQRAAWLDGGVRSIGVAAEFMYKLLRGPDGVSSSGITTIFMPGVDCDSRVTSE